MFDLIREIAHDVFNDLSNMAGQVGRTSTVADGFPGVYQQRLQWCKDRAYAGASVAQLVLTSPLLLTFGGIFSTAYFLSMKVMCCILGAVVSSMVKWPQHIPKKLHIEGNLVHRLFLDRLTTVGLMNSPYYNHIDRGVYISALPIKNHKSAPQHLKALGVKAVLAVVEDCEVELKTLFAIPVQKQDWTQNNIVFLQLPVVDLQSVPLQDLHQGADFIERHADGILVHCKAGKARSVMLVMANLIKHKKMTFDQAWMLVKLQRPTAKLKSWQIARLQEFSHALPEVST